MYPRYNQSYASSGRRGPPSDRQTAGTAEYNSSVEPSYRRPGRESFSSSRPSGPGVIPISTETYVDGIPVRSSRNGSTYDNYSDRSSRSSFSAGSPPRRVGPASTPMSSLSSRLAPAIVQDSGARQMSTSARSADPYDRDREYYTIPASTNPVREHKKVFSVDDSRGPRLVPVGNRESPLRAVPERSRRESFDGRGKPYHLSGPRIPAGVDNASGYEYTDARGMYNDTEPRWRPRTGSVGRERPSSMYETFDMPRPMQREPGPPPVTRGLEKLKGRTGSMHDPVRSPPRDRNRDSYTQDDGYDMYSRGLVMRKDKAPYPDHDDGFPPYPDMRWERDEYDDPRDPRESRAGTRAYQDREVATRGFGIRTSSVEAGPRKYSRGSFSIDPLEREAPRREVLEAPRREVLEPRTDLEEDNIDDYERPKDRNRIVVRDSDREDPRYQGREPFRERGKEREIPRDRDVVREPDRNFEADRRPRPKDAERENDREADRRRSPEDDRLPQQDQRDLPPTKEHRERVRDDEKPHGDRNYSAGVAGAAAAAAVAGAAAYGAHEHRERKIRDRAQAPSVDGSSDAGSKVKDVAIENRSDAPGRSSVSPDAISGRERHYVQKEDPGPQSEAGRDRREPETIDPDEEYRRRMQQEVERLRKSQPAKRQEEDDPSVESRRNERREHDREDVRDEQTRDAKPGHEEQRDRPEETALALVHEPDRHDSILESAIVDEPEDIPAVADRRVGIVEPPEEKAAPKSILRKPTEKFPDYPNTAREGVAPLKDSKKADIPEGAKWTKISRDLINPAALMERNERFEERRDVVIVLRVLTKEEVQEFADRTREIRLEREHHRDRRRHRHRRDAPDVDYDDEDSR